jgi:hypothetical protein
LEKAMEGKQIAEWRRSFTDGTCRSESKVTVRERKLEMHPIVLHPVGFLRVIGALKQFLPLCVGCFAIPDGGGHLADVDVESRVWSRQRDSVRNGSKSVVLMTLTLETNTRF